MSTFLDHARHNKKAFDYLNSATVYPDWTVTVAFYCAMHYCYAILFPLTTNGVTYNNIEQYFEAKKRVGDTKHGMTLNLIRQYHSIIGEKYKILKDIAHTSRYHDYSIAKPVVDQARKYLKAIEDYCENKCTSHTLPTSPQPIP
jgi:hypothetical protein